MCSGGAGYRIPTTPRGRKAAPELKISKGRKQEFFHRRRRQVANRHMERRSPSLTAGESNLSRTETRPHPWPDQHGSNHPHPCCGWERKRVRPRGKTAWGVRRKSHTTSRSAWPAPLVGHAPLRLGVVGSSPAWVAERT